MRLLISAIFDCESPFDFIFDQRLNIADPNDMDLDLENNQAALIIWGGEDIATGLYGQVPARQTGATVELSKRDRIEVDLAKKAIELGIPIIGICRGAQMMCALSGGSLIQHVTNHANMSHNMITNDGVIIKTNSVHHQMMNPFKVDHELLAWVPERISTVYIGNANNHVADTDSPDFKEPEIVWFPKTKSLCIQGHPEFSSASAPFIHHCLRLTEKYVLGNSDKLVS